MDKNKIILIMQKSESVKGSKRTWQRTSFACLSDGCLFRKIDYETKANSSEKLCLQSTNWIMVGKPVVEIDPYESAQRFLDRMKTIGYQEGKSG